MVVQPFEFDHGLLALGDVPEGPHLSDDHAFHDYGWLLFKTSTVLEGDCVQVRLVRAVKRLHFSEKIPPRPLAQNEIQQGPLVAAFQEAAGIRRSAKRRLAAYDHPLLSTAKPVGGGFEDDFKMEFIPAQGGFRPVALGVVLPWPETGLSPNSFSGMIVAEIPSAQAPTIPFEETRPGSRQLQFLLESPPGETAARLSLRGQPRGPRPMRATRSTPRIILTEAALQPLKFHEGGSRIKTASWFDSNNVHISARYRPTLGGPWQVPASAFHVVNIRAGVVTFEILSSASTSGTPPTNHQR